MKQESINNHLLAARISILSNNRARNVFRHNQRIFPGFNIELYQRNGDVKSTNEQT